MPQPISIRPARKSDREWCARLMASSEPWTTLKRGLRESRAALRRPGAQLFVARAGGRRVGFILVDSYGLAGAPYIPSVAVEASERGTGGGVMNFGSNFGGMISPIMTPWLATRLGWGAALSVISLLAVLSALLWLGVEIGRRREGHAGSEALPS